MGMRLDGADIFTDGGSDVETDEAALYQTSDIAVVLDKLAGPSGNHKVELFKLSANAQDVVKLFPQAAVDPESDVAVSGDERVYIIPVKNYGALNVYRLSLGDDLLTMLSPSAFQDEKITLDRNSQRDFNTITTETTGIGSDDADSDAESPAVLSRISTDEINRATLRTVPTSYAGKAGRQESVREAVRAALINELYADITDDGCDSGHETTVERVARRISGQHPVYVSGRRGRFGQMPNSCLPELPVSRRESVKRALCVADVLSRSAEDRQNTELFVSSAETQRGDSDKDIWLQNWEKVLQKLTIPEEALEKLQISCENDIMNLPTAATGGPDMTISAYI